MPNHFQQIPSTNNAHINFWWVGTLDVLRVLLAIGLLLVGQIDPEPRLVIGGIGLNTALAIFAIIFALVSQSTIKPVVLVFVLLFPLHVLGIAATWSQDFSYGIWKYSNLVLIVFISLLLVTPAINERGWRRFSKLWIFVSIVLLLLAIATKLQGGFFNRDIPFFINGPIVFARIMGIALFISIFAFKGFARLALVTIFMAAVIWTASKGPMLFALILLVAHVAFAGGLRFTIALFVVAAISLLVIMANLEAFSENSFARIIEATNYLIGEGPIPGSFTTRFEMFEHSYDLYSQNFFGVGLGGWAISGVVEMPWLYPHNLILEIFSEVGIFLGLIGILPFVWFLFSRNSPFFLAAMFLFACQQTSGDLLDARYLLFFSILCITVPKLTSVNEGILNHKPSQQVDSNHAFDK